MSTLQVNTDDHPEAAGKHLADAAELLGRLRWDGAAYLSGYVVECSLKSVLLHDTSYEPTSGHHDPTKLRAAHERLSRKLKHDLTKLAIAEIGTAGARYWPSHLADSPPASILDWRETLRYQPSGSVTEVQARDYHEWAALIFEETVIRMRLDGVL